MKIGKIPSELLEKIVLHPISTMHKRKEVIVPPVTGEDCSVIDFGQEWCLASMDPITGATADIGSLAVHINCNDIAASGGEAVGIMLTVLLPPESTDSVLSEIMRQARETAETLGVEIIGGHTEVTDAVTRPVVCAAVLGRTCGKRFLSSGGAEEGQDILMTKWAGLEGTAILAQEHASYFRRKLGNALVEKAIKEKEQLSVAKEAALGKKWGAACMHDVTEGGVFGALWEVAECSKKGIEVYPEKILVREETEAICRLCGISPYRLISSGCLLITTFQGEQLAAELAEQGIPASVIGRVTKEGRYLVEGNRKTVLPAPDSDALYQVNFTD